MDKSKFTELMKNESFTKKLFETNNSEELRNLFSENGIKLNDKDLKEVTDAISHVIKRLDTVKDSDLKGIIGGTLDGKSVAIGAGATAGIFALIVAELFAAYKLYRKGVEDGKDQAKEWLNVRNNKGQSKK